MCKLGIREIIFKYLCRLWNLLVNHLFNESIRCACVAYILPLMANKFDLIWFYYYFARGSGCEVLWWACLCVCLSVYEDISGITRAIFTKFFVHVAYGRGSELLRLGDKIPRGRGSFGCFISHWQWIVQLIIWDAYKNGWTNWDAVWDYKWTWPEEWCVIWGDDPGRGRGTFGENMPDKP